MMRMFTAVLAAILLLSVTATARGAPKPVPPSPYLGIVYRYADTMLKHGRDAHGPQKTGLLLSAIDPTTLAPSEQRPIADPRLDQNLLRVLYTLSELSGKPIYRDAADAELKWLLENAASPEIGLAPWDQGPAWNVVTDKPMPRRATTGESGAVGDAGHRLRPWILWDRCFILSPGASKRLVLGLRQASDGKPPSTRQSAFRIRAYAMAYQHTGDQTLLKAIETELGRLEPTGKTLASDSLSAAIDCGGAARRVPETLAKRLRDVAARQDQIFCDLPHDLKARDGFALAPRNAGAMPDEALTPLWGPRQDGHTTALLAMMCVSRYENTGDVRYRDLIHAAADAYRNSLPPADADVWPMTVGHVISLELAAWRSTARQEYLDFATKLADLAVGRFWSDGPLPRASSKGGHYETTTGVDTLALALVELHLSILHITAVRCPPNTIDR
jgi:hypothetical protein